MTTINSFVTPLIVKIHTIKPQDREVYVPFTYISTSNREITVPRGFFTNFASTPRILWAVLPPLDHYGKAAAIHDYIYRTPSLGFTKKEADLILKDACKALRVSPYKIFILYQAVHLFGFHAWNKYRK